MYKDSVKNWYIKRKNGFLTVLKIKNLKFGSIMAQFWVFDCFSTGCRIGMLKRIQGVSAHFPQSVALFTITYTTLTPEPPLPQRHSHSFLPSTASKPTSGTSVQRQWVCSRWGSGCTPEEATSVSPHQPFHRPQSHPPQFFPQKHLFMKNMLYICKQKNINDTNHGSNRF